MGLSGRHRVAASPAAATTTTTKGQSAIRPISLGSTIFLISIMVSCVANVAQSTHSPAAAAEVKKPDITTTMAPSQSKLKLRSYNDFTRHLTSVLKDNPKKLAILLDFDGTLAPITQHPKDTVITAEGDVYLRKLTERPDIFTAIVSGRGLADLKDKITIDGITRAGNHGLEIKYPDGSIYNYPIPDDLQRNYTKILDELRKDLARQNAWVEDKRVSITFHYREAPIELHEEMRLQAIDIIKRHGYNANQAHFAVEAKPPVQWNKGFASEFILETTFGKDWRDTVKVVVAGDDTTDEDAMRMLKGHGASFRVTPQDSIETDADFLLDSPMEVAHLLKWISENL